MRYLQKSIDILVVAAMISLMLICIYFVYIDYPKFTPGMAYGWKPTNRVGILVGLYICYFGTLFLISGLIDFTNKSRLLTFIRLKMGKKGSLQVGGLGLFMGIMAIIGGIFSFYN